MNKRSVTVLTLVGLVIIISVIGIVILIQPKSLACGGNSQEVVAKSLLQSLQSSVAIYKAQQHVPPKQFADFVTNTGAATGKYTLTLHNIQNQLSAKKGLHSKQLTLTFTKKGKATYYLNGTDVTATFSFP
jgi:hypothetical protein